MHHRAWRRAGIVGWWILCSHLVLLVPPYALRVNLAFGPSPQYVVVMSTEGNLKEVLGPVLRVLKGLGGKFVFTDSDGDTFVLMSKQELTRARQKQEQLPLPPARAVEAAVRQHAPDIAEDIIEAINRDIALSQNTPDVSGDDLALSPNIPPVPKLRFEPLKGDISPDLQE